MILFILWIIYCYIAIGFIFVFKNIKLIPLLIERIMEIDEDEVFGEKDFNKVKKIIVIMLILYWPRFINNFPN